MADLQSNPKRYIVYRENDPDFNRHVSQMVDSIIGNAVLRVTADRLSRTDSGRVSPNNEECIRRFASDYVNDVIIPGAIKKIEDEKTQQSSASNNQHTDLKLFVKDYVNDVIISCAIAKFQKLSNSNDDDSNNINDFVDSTIHNSAKTVAQEEHAMDTFAGEFVDETLNNIAFNPSQLLIDHHRHIMKLCVKETKQQIHTLLQKQRQNYLNLKSMMKQATHEKLQRSKMSQQSLYSCEILKQFCNPIKKETPDSVNTIQQHTPAILELSQQDTPAILGLSQTGHSNDLGAQPAGHSSDLLPQPTGHSSDLLPQPTGHASDLGAQPTGHASFGQSDQAGHINCDKTCEDFSRPSCQETWKEKHFPYHRQRRHWTSKTHCHWLYKAKENISS